MGLIAQTHGGLTIYNHAGVWGTTGGYVPSLDLALGVNVTQPRPRPMVIKLMSAVLDVVFDHYGVAFEDATEWP